MVRIPNCEILGCDKTAHWHLILTREDATTILGKVYGLTIERIISYCDIHKETYNNVLSGGRFVEVRV